MRLPLNDDRVIEDREERAAIWHDAIREALVEKGLKWLRATADKEVGDVEWLVAEPTAEDFADLLLSELDGETLMELTGEDPLAPLTEREIAEVLTDMGYDLEGSE